MHILRISIYKDLCPPLLAIWRARNLCFSNKTWAASNSSHVQSITSKFSDFLFFRVHTVPLAVNFSFRPVRASAKCDTTRLHLSDEPHHKFRIFYRRWCLCKYDPFETLFAKRRIMLIVSLIQFAAEAEGSVEIFAEFLGALGWKTISCSPARILRFRNLKFPFKALTVALVPQKKLLHGCNLFIFSYQRSWGGHRKAAGIVLSSPYMLLPLEMKFNIECAPHNKHRSAFAGTGSEIQAFAVYQSFNNFYNSNVGAGSLNNEETNLRVGNVPTCWQEVASWIIHSAVEKAVAAYFKNV